MKKENRNVQLHFFVTEPEAELIKERMAELGITNLSAYLRKMAVDGYNYVKTKNGKETSPSRFVDELLE